MTGLLGAVTAAYAGDDGASGSAVIRAIETLPDPIPLDDDGDVLQWGPALDTRLRVRGDAAVESVRGALEVDLFAGQLVGATWNLGPLDERGRDANDALGAAGFVPRVASLGARLPWLDVEAGLQTSDWGLGMLANGGSGTPLFGRTDFGDRVLRLRVATAPFGSSRSERFPLFLILAGDRVVSDELARWSDGDVALQGIAAVLYRPPPTEAGPLRAAGLYGVLRDEHDVEGLHTGARVLDGFASLRSRLPGAGWTVDYAAEAALVSGRTEAAASYAAPHGLAVRSGGLAVRARVADPDERLQLWGNLALASGDRSPDDGRVGDFRFDRDYDVGFVLFDELMAGLDLGAYRQATDPSVVGEPPSGAETLVAEGAFHQALALQPAAEVAATRWLGIRAGTVFAWSTAPIAQPFTTFRNGGVPTNHVGVATDGRYLGTELDWALVTRPAAVKEWSARPTAALQVGHLWPSADLAPDVDRLDHVLLVGTLGF